MDKLSHFYYMIAKITPLIRLPSNLDAFDYFVPDELQNKIKIGQFVSIPWRNKTQTGIVLSLAQKQESSEFRARPITGIIDENPAISCAQMKLIKTFSKYYFCSKGYVARLMCPIKPKRAVAPKAKSQITNKFQACPEACPEYARGNARGIPIFKISKSQLEKLDHFLVSWPRGNPVTDANCNDDDITSWAWPVRNDMVIQDVSSFVWLILRLIKKTPGQLLVLFPTIDLINTVASIVHKKCSDNLAIIHSELSKTEYWNQYQKILSNKARVILSTRQGVFLPIQNKSSIVFFESTSQDFKQYDQHPRYDARIVSQWVAKVTDSRILFCSGSVLIRYSEQVSKCESNESLKLPPARNPHITVKLIDMENEMSRKEFSIISDTALEAIKRLIKNNKKALIISLRQDAEQGVSVNKITNILTKQIKDCRISTEYVSNQNFDILATTAYALEALKLRSMRREFGIAIFASIEPLLAIPDFRSNERAFNRLNFWKIMCQELEIPSIILQTYSPENPAIRAVAYGEVDVFIKEELARRKQLNYPPFSRIIKLSLSGNSEQGQDEVKNLADNARLILTKFFHSDSASQNAATILGPIKNRKNQTSFILKLGLDADDSCLNSLSDSWTIDKDPENIL